MTDSTTPRDDREVCPFPQDEPGYEFDARAEINALNLLPEIQNRHIIDLMDDIDQAGTEEMFSATLDWAFHLRTTQKLTWKEALAAATIAMFG